MKRDEFGNAYYEEGDVMFWVLASPDGPYDEDDERRDLAAIEEAQKQEGARRGE